ncbi:MAG: GTPase ObgE [Candidatus Moranbacteria bacterium]|jgi:GTP-binding protein|nr:GTPase ObgE [Candidatus Moranbacteria bacterium]
MLIDDVTIEVGAGKGGDGAVAFNKNMLSLGPTGGDGGNGGDVFLEGVSNIGALKVYRNQKVFHAEDGKRGGQQRKTGGNGENLYLKVPVGTVIHFANGTIRDVFHVGEKILVASGGEGGRGNFSFRSSRNTSPKESTLGTEGKKNQLRLELKLIADVGFVGLPNAGKSSLINELTNANSRVGNYNFTTLEPSLGAYYDLILADIPGLIEGASEGKGLGIKFLRHIERTRVIFHFVSCESDDPARDYEIIRKELAAHNPELIEKDEYLFLSKSDLLPEKELAKKMKVLQKINPEAIAISIIDENSLQKVKNILAQVAEKRKMVE